MAGLAIGAPSGPSVNLADNLDGNILAPNIAGSRSGYRTRDRSATDLAIYRGRAGTIDTVFRFIDRDVGAEGVAVQTRRGCPPFSRQLHARTSDHHGNGRAFGRIRVTGGAQCHIDRTSIGSRGCRRAGTGLGAAAAGSTTTPATAGSAARRRGFSGAAAAGIAAGIAASAAGNKEQGK